MNRLKIRKMDSKTKHNLLGSYCSAIGLLNFQTTVNEFRYGVAETIRGLKELNYLLTRAQRVRDELTDDDINVIGEVRMTKFDGILATGRILMHRAKYMQSHHGKCTGYSYDYPNNLRDLKAVCRFSGKDFNDWVQEVNNGILFK